MSTEPAPEAGKEAPDITCPVCGQTVPRGAFCGFCGVRLFPQLGGWAGRLRIGAYAAAPGEHVLRLSVVTSLFPHLPHRSRAPFRAGLAVLIVALVVFALLRWQAPLVGVSALGFLLLFYIYLQECDVYDDELPRRTLQLTAVVGVVLGVGWALLTGPVVAASFNVTPGAGVAWERVLRDGLAIPLGTAVLMLVPAVLVRVLRPPTRESLDGFLIGTVGAIGFTAASTLTRLAPQLATGLVARHRPVGGLLVEAGIQGVAVPLTAAAAGGMVGAGLWFIRRADLPPPRWAHWLAAPVPAVVVVLVLYAGVGLIDVAQIPPGVQLGLHLLVTALAVLALRIVLHAALLHEEHKLRPGGLRLCSHCAHVVPDMAFCPNCGVATRASSRKARTARRLGRPVHTDTTPEAP